MSEPCELPEDHNGYLNHLLEHIVEDGFTTTHVAGDHTHPSYAHTLGLVALGHPELLVTGLAPELSAVMTPIAHDIAFHGLRLRPGRAWHAEMRLEFYLLPITRARRRLWTVVDLYGPDVSGLQLVWQDTDEGRYPWDSSGHDALQVHPLLGRTPRRHELARPCQSLLPARPPSRADR